ncbi:MAG: S10 family serine carboxypeptidase-like protein [Methylococcus sp.]
MNTRNLTKTARKGFVGASLVLFSWLTLIPDASRADTPIAPESGFQEIEPIPFSFKQKGKRTLRYTSSRARIFYSLQPADQNPESQPTFVIFNGGPGCATSNGLMAWNTRTQTLDPLKGNPIVANPHSWTALGNLLYIDAPASGFSYNLLDKPAGKLSRARLKREFTARNFNTYLDAAQMLRLVLRVLRSHAAISANPVILVGESYGGVRSTLMLDFLLHYPEYNGQQFYRDPGLVQEVGDYLRTTLGSQTADPASIARIFGRQLLIQPLVTGAHQLAETGSLFEAPDSIIRQLAWNYRSCAQQGKRARQCKPESNALKFISQAGRSPYQYDWLVASDVYLLVAVDLRLLDIPTLSELLAQDPATITSLHASQRSQAYKTLTTRADLEKLMNGPRYERMDTTQQLWTLEAYLLSSLQGRQGATGVRNLAVNPVENRLHGPTLEQQLGALNRWDAYFTGCNSDALNAFYANNAVKANYLILPDDPSFGALFLRNLPYLKVFMTNARKDLVIYSDAIPPSFLRYQDQVADARVERSCPDAACDGILRIQLKNSQLQAQDIRYPAYAASGHMVSWTMPEKLLADVKDWLTH